MQHQQGNQELLVQPLTEFYNLQQLYQQGAFSGYMFGLDPVVDQHTPHIAFHTANEIQRSCGQGHPIRIATFNYLSDNAYNNQPFAELVMVIARRMLLSAQAQEYSLQHQQFIPFMNQAIKAYVSAYGGFLACQDQNFLVMLTQQDQDLARRNAQRWTRLYAVAMGNAPFEPLAASAMNGGGGQHLFALTPQQQATGGVMTMGQPVRRNTGATVSGAFSESSGGQTPDYTSSPTGAGRWGNNAQEDSNRFRQKLDESQGVLPGSMQESLSKAIRSQSVNNVPDYANLDQPIPAANTWQVKPTIPAATPAAPVAQEVVHEAPLQSTFELKFEGKAYTVVSQLSRELGDSLWKPSEAQRFRPLVNVRTHQAVYVKTSEGLVLAISRPLNPEEKKELVDYDRHAINPNLGKPDPQAKPRPAREEAKILYEAGGQATEGINIELKTENMLLTDSMRGLIDDVLHDAEAMDPRAQAVYQEGGTVQTVVYADQALCAEDLATLEALRNSASFKEAARHLADVKLAWVRTLLQRWFVDMINNTLINELSVDVSISDFVEDAPELVSYVRANAGDQIADALVGRQRFIIEAVVNVDKGNQDQTGLNDRTLTLRRNASVTWVDFSDDELGMSIPDVGSAEIARSYYPVLNEIVRKSFDSSNMENNTKRVFQRFLVTRDNVVYRLHRGLLNSQFLMISQVRDQLAIL